ncbi:hypothetical protein KBD08_00170 [Candidatus Babeliales bacterium]|nr:hypothetical protein [Candidatus Babeliales bacterium]
MPVLQQQSQTLTQRIHENILVVPRATLFQNHPVWHGIKTCLFDDFCANIQQHASYMPRPHAETNPIYKQIIPYVLFTYDKKLFVMQRKSTASEQRLASKFSLGIGGHIRHEDIQNNNIMSWAQREFNEEVTYAGSTNTVNIGILNDDSTSVGQVHLGIILLMKGNNDKISINDEHKSGTLLTLAECQNIYHQMESWSQLCLDFILQHPNILE